MIKDVTNNIKNFSNVKNMSSKMKYTCLSTIINLLYPFVPFITSEMSEKLSIDF